jgi:hypothetical protein
VAAPSTDDNDGGAATTGSVAAPPPHGSSNAHAAYGSGKRVIAGELRDGVLVQLEVDPPARRGDVINCLEQPMVRPGE